MRRALAALLAAAALACVSPAAVPAAPRSADDTAELVDALNRHRAGIGCAPLGWHEGAARAALAHAEDMRRRGYFDHDTPEGLKPRDRLRAAGVQVRGATAENMVATPYVGERLLGRWLASPEHRKNIDDCAFTHHGIGRAGNLWVHLFLTVRP